MVIKQATHMYRNVDTVCAQPPKFIHIQSHGDDQPIKYRNQTIGCVIESAKNEMLENEIGAKVKKQKQYNNALTKELNFA